MSHAVAGPSSAGMWMKCPASVTLAEGKSRPSSVYAKEGTAAHKIAEMIIGGDLFPPSKITVEGQQFIVGRNMLQHLNPYISAVQHLQGSGFKVFTETKVGISVSKGLVWGTADCLAYGSSLHVLDLKYGKGVTVSPDSAQLKIYALGGLEAHGYRGVQDIVMSIYQPRLDPQPKTVVMTRHEIIDWRDRELLPAVDRLVNNDTSEVAGAHCRWCVRRDVCGAYAAHRSGRASDVFNDQPLDGVEI